jgi:hypothetical protein
MIEHITHLISKFGGTLEVVGIVQKDQTTLPTPPFKQNEPA